MNDRTLLHLIVVFATLSIISNTLVLQQVRTAPSATPSSGPPANVAGDVCAQHPWRCEACRTACPTDEVCSFSCSNCLSICSIRNGGDLCYDKCLSCADFCKDNGLCAHYCTQGVSDRTPYFFGVFRASYLACEGDYKCTLSSTNGILSDGRWTGDEDGGRTPRYSDTPITRPGTLCEFDIDNYRWACRQWYRVTSSGVEWG